VSKHNTEKDCWVIINGSVYDVSKFLALHPGGKKILLGVGGTDASKQFSEFHNISTLQKYERLKIGTAALPTKKSDKVTNDSQGPFIAYGDPAWIQGLHSPFYNSSHIKFRKAMREFVDRELMPFVHEWDEAKQLPSDLRKKCVSWLPGIVGAWPTKYVGDRILGGVRPEEWDVFHELIIHDELSRTGGAGLIWGLMEGITIGLPPILNFGSEYLQKKVVTACLTGNAAICLGITEPSGGSDVANLRTTAKKTSDGKFYIVNGIKKWITNGVFADYFTVACQTGGNSGDGNSLSLLLLERSFGGIITKQMQCQGVWSSGTTYITFEDVKVPVENLIGKEGLGFKYVMYNFNHERWGIIAQVLRLSRVCYEEAFQYAHKRKTFGVPLIQNAVIRGKLGNMIRKVESAFAWFELLTYQMKMLPYEEQMKKLSGPIALLKVESTMLMEFCAREAVQIFGGLGYTRGGQGDKVERIYRDVRAYAIGGGSEEIMLDYGIRQAIKYSKL